MTLSFACRPHLPETPLVISPDEELEAVTLDVISCINHAAHKLVLAIGTGQHSIRVRYFDDGPHVCGSFDDSTETINVNYTHWVCKPDIVLIHELGHALGAGHNPSRDYVMYKDVQPGMDPSWACLTLISEFDY